MIFDIPFLADWNKIGDYRQSQTDRSAERENSKRVDYDYKVGDKVLIRKDGILRKAEQHDDEHVPQQVVDSKCKGKLTHLP